MSLTWGELKTDLRLSLWPIGEAPELVVPHDKIFLDAIMDLQEWVKCLQQDNTNLYPACSTYYHCGLTVFDAPRGAIKKLSVVAQTTADSDPDYCDEIEYRQVAYKDIEKYLRALSLGRFGPLSFPFASFFCLDSAACRKPIAPVATDVGLPAGLTPLKLGFHYPQGSTDRPYRSRSGVWAIERGKIWIAPWINVVEYPETVILKWDGIKRTWSDEDPIDPDPDLASAIEEFVRSEHARKYDRDMEVAESAGQAYQNARMKLIRQCREETRIRDREPSYARNSVATMSASTLYYNDTAYSATGTADSSDCPSGETANGTTSASVTIQAGTVGSSTSVPDANSKAQAQAQTEAKAAAIAKLVCSDGTTGTTTFTSQAQADVTVSCTTDDPNAPAPTGASVTKQVPAGRATSTISQDDANQKAINMVIASATSQLSCKWYNSAQTVTLTCPNDNTITATGTCAAGVTNSTVSQSVANSLAQAAAKVTAGTNLTAAGCSSSGTGVYNPQAAVGFGSAGCTTGAGSASVQFTVRAGTYATTKTNGTTTDAQAEAQAFADSQAQLIAKSSACMQLHGQYFYEWP